MAPLVLGIDLGTSGVRVAVLDAQGALQHSASASYERGLSHAEDWRAACQGLIRAIPDHRRSSMNAHRRRWITDGPYAASAALCRGQG